MRNDSANVVLLPRPYLRLVSSNEAIAAAPPVAPDGGETGGSCPKDGKSMVAGWFGRLWAGFGNAALSMAAAGHDPVEIDPERFVSQPLPKQPPGGRLRCSRKSLPLMPRLYEALRRRRARLELERLSEEQLKDIGLTRWEAMREPRR